MNSFQFKPASKVMCHTDTKGKTKRGRKGETDSSGENKREREREGG